MTLPLHRLPRTPPTKDAPMHLGLCGLTTGGTTRLHRVVTCERCLLEIELLEREGDAEDQIASENQERLFAAGGM